MPRIYTMNYNNLPSNKIVNTQPTAGYSQYRNIVRDNNSLFNLQMSHLAGAKSCGSCGRV